MKRTLIVGSEGQDGQLLFEHLADNVVVGLGRNSIRSSDGQRRTQTNVLDAGEVSSFIAEFKPDEIYYLAAHHRSSEDQTSESEARYEQRTHDVHVVGLTHCLEAMRTHAQDARLFYAASSHIYRGCDVSPQSEQTDFAPLCAYGRSKVEGIKMCRLYRKKHGLFTSVGILFNHESHLRRPQFVSRKIVSTAVAIAAGKRSELRLGDFGATVDWGYAPDYVAAMTKILGHHEADDFVIATGVPHTVADFVGIAFEAVDLDWRDYVREDPNLLSKPQIQLLGDATKLRETTGWKPTMSFDKMIETMVQLEHAK